MNQSLSTELNEATRRNKIHPYKLALWIGLGSIIMMFTALTSAYVVRMAAGNWLEFRIPNIFYWNTAIIVASSVTLHLAWMAFKRESKLPYRAFLSLTFVLGVLFLYVQYLGWIELSETVPLKTNPAGDFLYVLSALHGIHVVGGLAILIVALLVAFAQPVRVTPMRELRFQLTITYWHFIDLLWIYLLVFMSLQR